MLKKITELTKEQEDKLAIYRDKWIAIGCSTEPMNKEKASSAIDIAYVCARTPPPKIKIWLKSPYEGVISAWWLKQVLKILHSRTIDQVKAKIIAETGDQAGDQIGNKLRSDIIALTKTDMGVQFGSRLELLFKEQLNDPLKDQVRDRIWGNIWNNAKEQIKAEPTSDRWGQIWDVTWAQIWQQIWQQKPELGAQIGAQIKADVLAQTKDKVKVQIEDLLSTQSHCAGLHDAGSFAMFDFFGSELGLNVKRMEGLISTAEHCGWFWPFGGAVIITEKPCELLRDNKGRLHADAEMAIKFQDGWDVGMWHDTRVPNWVITNPEEINLDKILDEKDSGARRVMRERFGAQDFFIAMMREKKVMRLNHRKDPLGHPISLFRYDDYGAAIHFFHTFIDDEDNKGQKKEIIISCRNFYEDAWDSIMGTYPELMKTLKNDPKRYQILKSSVR